MKTKNCNGKWKGAWRVGKNREMRQIAQSVKLKQTKKKRERETKSENEKQCNAMKSREREK